MALSSQTNDEKHQYSEPWEDSDVVLIVEDEKLHVHSMILSIASPVFKAMLSSNFKEGREKVISLSGKEKSFFLMLLNLIYPINYKVTGFTCCRPLLELAREYEIKKVMQYIDDFIYIEVECSFAALQLAEEFHLERSKQKYIAYYINLKCNNGGFNFKGKWTVVSDKTKNKILLGKIEKMIISEDSCRSCNYRQDNVTWEHAKELKRTAKVFSLLDQKNQYR